MWRTSRQVQVLRLFYGIRKVLKWTTLVVLKKQIFCLIFSVSLSESHTIALKVNKWIDVNTVGLIVRETQLPGKATASLLISWECRDWEFVNHMSVKSSVYVICCVMKQLLPYHLYDSVLRDNCKKYFHYIISPLRLFPWLNQMLMKYMYGPYSMANYFSQNVNFGFNDRFNWDNSHFLPLTLMARVITIVEAHWKSPQEKFQVHGPSRHFRFRSSNRSVISSRRTSTLFRICCGRRSSCFALNQIKSDFWQFSNL